MTVWERLKRLFESLFPRYRGRVRDLDAWCDTDYAGAYDWPLEVYRDFRVARLTMEGDRDD